MDSDIHFKEKRPHILYVDQTILSRLLISDVGDTEIDKKRKKKATSLDDEDSQAKVHLFRRSLELGVILPRDSLNVDRNSKSNSVKTEDGSPQSDSTLQIYQPVVLAVDDNAGDPTIFEVCIKPDILETIYTSLGDSGALNSAGDRTITGTATAGSGLKRKRKSSSKNTQAPAKHVLFTLQVLDDYNAISREIPFLTKSFPKNFKVYVEPPRLELAVTSQDKDNIYLSGAIKYSFSVGDTAEPLGFWGMKSRTFQSLLSVLLNDETFVLPTNSLGPALSPATFYEIISKNKNKLDAPASIFIPDLSSNLLKYQRETVRWCLRREGKDLLANGNGVIDLDQSIRNFVVSPPVGWRSAKFLGKDIWINPYSGSICSDEEFNRFMIESPAARSSTVAGGLLAEEMGLGKTVEMIALMLLNKRPKAEEGVAVYDAFASRTVRKSRTTLIISPASISSQWVRELEMHAPMLKVYYYKGARKLKGSIKAEDLAQYDVVVTSYSVISFEIHFALFNPEARNTRQGTNIHPELEAKKSPLMHTEFWRVILDEAQMVSSGVNGAAKVAQMIPRVHSWAVTGTPVRRHLDDLQGLMVFFRIQPFAISKRAWSHLLASPADFEDVFSQLSIRHTAFMVKDDIVIPPQSRVSMHLSFNSIEETNYRQLYAEFLYNVGLEVKPNGRIGYKSQNPGDTRAQLTAEQLNELDLATSLDYGKLAIWFQRLRQACSHPRVGSTSRRAFGGSAVDTMDDLLDGMLEQAESQLSNYQRRYYSSMIERGQLKEAQHLPQEALDLWYFALKGVEDIVKVLRADVATAKEEQMKKKSREANEVKEENDDADKTSSLADNLTSVDDGLGEDEDEDNSDVKERRARLRSWLEVLHRCYFFVATANFQLYKRIEDARNASVGADTEVNVAVKTEPVSVSVDSASDGDIDIKSSKFRDLENKYYEHAEVLRRELLRDSISKVNKAIGKIKDAKTGKFKKLTKIPLSTIAEDHVSLGLESQGFFEQLNTLGAELDKQAVLITKWREELVNLSVERLVDQNADPDGEEYGESLDDQEKAFCYLEVLQGLLSDRSEALTGSSDPVVNKAVKFERNKTANSLDARKNIDAQDSADGKVSNEQKRLKTAINQPPQKSEFQLELEELRRKSNPVQRMSMRSILANAKRRAAFKDQSGSFMREKLEADVIEGMLPEMQKVFDGNNRALKALQRELAGFKNVYNARVEYYRQLQELSDTVTSLELDEQEPNFAIKFEDKHNKEENNLERLMERLQSRISYLNSLKSGSDGRVAEEEKTCIICREIILIGSLTVCGHKFCRACLQEWWKHKRQCPMCKTSLNHSQVYNFRVMEGKLTEVNVETSRGSSKSNPDETGSEAHYLSRSNPIYHEVERDTLDAIVKDESFEDASRYGTKVDVIMRHLHWLRSKEPDAQVVIFSQWAEMLSLLDFVLTQRGILHASVKSHMNEFRNDSSYACFLLHAKNESAGLTLVNATHVYLCEPLVNTALEVQAISRIHRIGQTKPTTVWLFVIGDTVEEAVLRLSTEKRLSFLKSAATQPADHDATGVVEVIEDIDADNTEMLSKDEIELANSHELTKSVGKMFNAPGSGGGEAVQAEDLCKALITYHYQRVE